MELLAFGKDMLHSFAEQAASYRIGQAALRHVDRALWVVEKCARWAVPPPLDQDERPQPELIRPLPWVLFLALLITLRVTRESISLINLVLGKPPLRSADVVMYIQSKRRYLRTLKYQGNRIIRARSTTQREPWYRGLQSLFEFTMCFRTQSHYGNNNTTTLSNNDEVLVVKRKRSGEQDISVASTSETTMERLIEKMMVDLDVDSEDDSSFTLTNATSHRSDQSDIESEHDVEKRAASPKPAPEPDTAKVQAEKSPDKPKVISSTPEKDAEQVQTVPAIGDKETSPKKSNEQIKDKSSISKPSEPKIVNHEDAALQSDVKTERQSPKQETKKFLQSEICSPPKPQQSTSTKIGRKILALSKTFARDKREGVESMDLQRRDNGRGSRNNQAEDSI